MGLVLAVCRCASGDGESKGAGKEPECSLLVTDVRPVGESAASVTDQPLISNVLAESGFPINLGDSPPPIGGSYVVSYMTVDASEKATALLGSGGSGRLCLFGQTSGSIDEAWDGDDEIWTNGLVTGSGSEFTLWRELTLDLGDGCTIELTGIDSASRPGTGDLWGDQLAVVRDAEPACGMSLRRGVWWRDAREWRRGGECADPCGGTESP